MRRCLRLACIALIAACGSTPPTIAVPPAPPPPPPPPGVSPATVAILAGDGQQGEPGDNVSIRPIVVVKDAAGLKVAGVTVTFAVDSGGGSLQNTTATTATDGTASPGDWRLGMSEGRNVLHAVVGSLTPAKIAANAVYAPATVATSTISSGGGTLTINKPGSPINGVSLSVPDAALSQSATFSFNIRSSAGISFTERAGSVRAAKLARAPSFGPTAILNAALQMSGAPIPAVLPLITLQVTGPQSAAAQVLITIPLPAGTTGDVMVAVLDAANNPITFLPLLDATLTSVTVSTQAFDWHMYAVAGSGAAPAPASPSQQYTLTLAVFPVPRSTGATQPSQVLDTYLQVPFTLGKHNFEFGDVATTLASRTDAGAVLAEYGAIWMYPGGIYNSNQRAVGVPASNTRGIMLVGGLSKSAAAVFAGRNGAAWIAYYYHNAPAAYMRNMGYSIYYALGSGYPVPLVLTDGTHTRMVLVVGWIPSSSYFQIYDPAFPNQFGVLTYTSAGMGAYVDPYDPTIRYTIPYYSRQIVTEMWPEIYGGLAIFGAPTAEPYSGNWPAEKISSRDTIKAGATKWGGVDTLFMVGDTTRIWYSKQGGHVVYASPYPIPSGHNIETASVYQRNGSTWTYNAAASGPSIPIDVRTAGQGGRAFQASLGINIQEYEPTGTSWLYFHMLDVVKFAVDVQMVPTLTKSAEFTVTQPGGPSLPLDARYHWDFGDGTPIVIRSTKSTFMHTFPTPGPYTVTLRILHATDDNVVLAKVLTEYPPLTVAIAPATLLASPGNPKTLTATLQGTPPASARYRWIYGDGSKWDTTSAPTTTHTYTTIGTYAIYMQVLDADSVIAAAVPAQALVKVYPAAWRITSFTLKSFTTVTGGAPAPWAPAMTTIEAFLAQVLQTPSDGMIFLEDNVLFNEHAVYFQVAPAGAGANAIYYVNNSFLTLLARAQSIQSSHYTSTGDMKSGTIDGEGYTSNTFSASSYIVEDNFIVAQKNGTTMTGTITIGPYAFGGARTYNFVATLVTP